MPIATINVMIHSQWVMSSKASLMSKSKPDNFDTFNSINSQSSDECFLHTISLHFSHQYQYDSSYSSVGLWHSLTLVISLTRKSVYLPSTHFQVPSWHLTLILFLTLVAQKNVIQEFLAFIFGTDFISYQFI